VDYLHDPKKIYNQSFEIIRKEADFSKVPKDITNIVVRLIHACGMIDILEDLEFSFDVAQSAKLALNKGAPILCDARMVVEGIIHSKLPENNEVFCCNNIPECIELAKRMQTTRSAAAVEFWRSKISGSIVAIGNAPTTLFRLLEILEEGIDPPAAIFGLPVGFVGAEESKELLKKKCRGKIPFLTITGRRGGSAMAAAAVNALSNFKK
tara:strand:+ start:994 stop:1620 length:627 start_codon:yes stop_codon:yes gene_type:complete